MRSDMGSAVADQTRTTTRSCRVHAYSPGVAAVPAAAAAAAAVTAALLAAAAAAAVIRQFTD